MSDNTAPLMLLVGFGAGFFFGKKRGAVANQSDGSEYARGRLDQAKIVMDSGSDFAGLASQPAVAPKPRRGSQAPIIAQQNAMLIEAPQPPKEPRAAANDDDGVGSIVLEQLQALARQGVGVASEIFNAPMQRFGS